VKAQASCYGPGVSAGQLDVEAVMNALPVFMLAAAVAALGFALTCLLHEMPLRDTAAAEAVSTLCAGSISRCYPLPMHSYAA